MSYLNRRRFIAGTAVAGLATGVAGCVGNLPGQSDDSGAVESDPDGAVADDTDDDEPAQGGEGPPIADRNLPLDYTIEELNDASMSGGPPPDGIPSIDEPNFNAANNPPSNLVDESPVFGVVIDGEARAYPQNILVWHEIVNDDIAGEPVAVTYCPLTGTAQGFYRGNVEFGVSGQLINTNLVMFDRTTESWWPQILAYGIRGPHEGDFLAEFQLIWTTWERWVAEHPDTLVLNENTGFARNYGNDPYGTYVPMSGYYDNDSTLFPTLDRDDRFAPKDVVIGMRNEDGAMCVLKDQVRDDRLIEGTLDGTEYVSVYEPNLDTAYVYRNPDGIAVEVSGEEYEVDGSTYGGDELPLDRQIAYDAMWVAWFGYYPSTDVFE